MDHFNNSRCEACGELNCNGGQDAGDREFHQGYWRAKEISRVRKQYGNRMAMELELEDERHYGGY